jgi:hypothetical protein
MWSLILKAALSYLESHPDQVAELIGEGVTAGVNALKNHNSSQAVAKILPQ